MKRFCRFISLVLTVLALDVALASNPIPAEAAGTLYVDNNEPLCHSGTYNTIQKAVDAALVTPGITRIVVCPGTYQAHVEIDGASKLELLAKGDVTIIPESFPLEDDLIAVRNSGNVRIEGFTIDGQGKLKSGSGFPYSPSAIYYGYSAGTIANNTIVNWHTPGYISAGDVLITGIHVFSLGPPVKVVINKNTITGFQGQGITAAGKILVSITGNTLTSTITNQDPFAGIQVYSTPWSAESGPDGQPRGKVANNWLTGYDFPVGSNSHGIEFTNASNFIISNNSLTHWGTGIHILSHCPLIGSADNLKVQNNRLYEVQTGIALVAQIYSGCSGDVYARNDRIIANKMSRSIPGGVGIWLSASGSNPPNSFIQDVLVARNKIVNFNYPTLSGVTPGSSITGTIQPN